MIAINAWLSPKSYSSYICPICNEEFEKYNECSKHIKDHVTPKQIIHYSNGIFPDKISVRMSDESLAVYEFKEFVVEEKEDEVEDNFLEKTIDLDTKNKNDEPLPF